MTDPVTSISDTDQVVGVVPLPRDYSLEEVAEALGMSARWVRDRVRLDKVAHQRYGHKIRFTADQVEALRAAHATAPLGSQPMTTGRRKRAAS